ncbi:MAG: tRNA (adenosine(37)-N6)-threonylcarbamoyltransferase complex ATPase subunit type 1 TsaE [Candidatus Eisenbacteria bacterium]|nr:tRNA (adenosine(37)-N6)-threonylcarbamoyltransferase complex ATPase subunit type 1 TsaE [Candidatus Eisenbacteria bacterium]
MRSLVVEVVTDSETETVRFGERLGAALRSRAVVGLVGPLGAGKTRLAQGIARGAGYAGRVRSPTFALLHLYRGPVPLRHFDLYRLDALDAGTAGEWEEAMDTEGISMVEWADRHPELLPEEAVWVTLEPRGESRRRVVVSMRLPNGSIGFWRLP